MTDDDLIDTFIVQCKLAGKDELRPTDLLDALKTEILYRMQYDSGYHQE